VLGKPGESFLTGRESEAKAALGMLGDGSSDMAQAFGASVIAKMCIEAPERQLVSSLGGVEQLVHVCQRTKSSQTRLMSLHALLHLSIFPPNQVTIARLGIRDLSDFARTEPKGQVETFTCVYASMILENCERNAKNRSRMYREELRCKVADLREASTTNHRDMHHSEGSVERIGQDSESPREAEEDPVAASATSRASPMRPHQRFQAAFEEWMSRLVVGGSGAADKQDQYSHASPRSLKHRTSKRGSANTLVEQVPEWQYRLSLTRPMSKAWHRSGGPHAASGHSSTAMGVTEGPRNPGAPLLSPRPTPPRSHGRHSSRRPKGARTVMPSPRGGHQGMDTTALLYELKNSDMFEPWSPRFEPVHQESLGTPRRGAAGSRDSGGDGGGDGGGDAGAVLDDGESFTPGLSEEDKQVLRRWRRKRKASVSPAYSMKLAESQQTVHFGTGLCLPTSSAPQSKQSVNSFKHVDGCHVCKGLYDHVTLPDGTQVHHFCKKWSYHMDPEIIDLPPKPPGPAQTIGVFTSPRPPAVSAEINTVVFNPKIFPCPFIELVAREPPLRLQPIADLVPPSATKPVLVLLDEPIECQLVVATARKPHALLRRVSGVPEAPGWDVSTTKVWSARAEQCESQAFFTDTPEFEARQLELDLQRILAHSSAKKTCCGGRFQESYPPNG